LSDTFSEETFYNWIRSYTKHLFASLFSFFQLFVYILSAVYIHQRNFLGSCNALPGHRCNMPVVAVWMIKSFLTYFTHIGDQFFMNIGNMNFQVTWKWKWFATSDTNMIFRIFMNTFNVNLKLGFLTESFVTFGTFIIFDAIMNIL